MVERKCDNGLLDIWGPALLGLQVAVKERSEKSMVRKCAELSKISVGSNTCAVDGPT